MIKALATMTMILMQKNEKDDREGSNPVLGVEDTGRWPLDSPAFQFLLATSSVSSIDELRQHAFIFRRPPRGELVDLVRFALIAARISYI